MTDRSNIETCHTGTELIGSIPRRPTGVLDPYRNVAPEMFPIYQTMKTTMMSWYILTCMEEVEGGIEVWEKERERQHPMPG